MSLTELEQRLVEAATEGDELQCRGGEIRANVIRSLLVGQWTDEPLDPHGIQVADARITGSLDLDGMDTKTQLRFSRCRFTERITAQRAHLRLLALECCELSLRRARLRGDDTVAVDLRWASAARVWFDSAMLRQGGDAERPDTWRPGGTIHLEGFVYTALDSREAGAADTLLEWIRHSTPSYAPQPYRQLAAYHRSLGHETEARGTQMPQQHDALRRGAITGAVPRLGQRLFGLLLGYGYRTWRALAALVVVVALACGTGVAAGHTPADGGAPAAARPDGTACSIVEQIGVGLHRGLPVISTGISDRCDLRTTSLPGQLYTVAGWVVQVAAWALATLVVAGYTGLIRKRE
ncbi:MAG: hypothetical protein GEV11_00510 [Streptosporangiales bacterium]|nr:hypothetical protein [Streptosporangiales bacterium]